jgi:hypothetical protein
MQEREGISALTSASRIDSISIVGQTASLSIRKWELSVRRVDQTQIAKARFKQSPAWKRALACSRQSKRCSDP